ncbi:MAG: preprotein translocase subunit SecA, partial [Patescibacteria group bacterium]
MSILTKILGDPNEKIIKDMLPIVGEINKLEEKFEKMSDEELKDMTDKFKERLSVTTSPPAPVLNKERGDRAERDRGEVLSSLLPDAFAVVREAAKRTLKQRHYDVQLMGGIVLHRGQITEMKTGEGKTLVATLPVYLNALSGRGVHVVTVNDYLARRDAGWMGQIYYALGMSTGVIIHDAAYIYDPNIVTEGEKDEKLKHFRLVQRKEAYQCDITYGTNNEFGFDYLRDNMAPNSDKTVQRELHYTIVDEIDSILIDEARTPLIISAPAEESTDKYFKFADLVKRLKENVLAEGFAPEDGQVEQGDYNIDEKMRAVTLTEAGIAKMEKWLGVDNIYVSGGIREVHHIEQALKALVLFKRDKDYVVHPAPNERGGVKDNEVIIVDEFTGRLMPGRRYSEGLHQAIEAKEGVAIQRESQTLATITFQNYFRTYKKLAGMTGTAVTEAEEFSKIYNLETVIIPTNKPMVRRDMNDLIYRTEEGKYKAVIKDVKERSKKGQPVLVGTISIEKNEMLKDMMEREGLKPEILNAKNHTREAQIIAQAGRTGAITIATNMAGRGVDIVLGGNPPDKEEQKKVIESGGLHVIGTERHEARRIDNQLRGRAGRQGDAGSSRFYVSTDDDLMRIFGG